MLAWIFSVLNLSIFFSCKTSLCKNTFHSDPSQNQLEKNISYAMENNIRFFFLTYECTATCATGKLPIEKRMFRKFHKIFVAFYNIDRRPFGNVLQLKSKRKSAQLWRSLIHIFAISFCMRDHETNLPFHYLCTFQHSFHATLNFLLWIFAM